MSILPDSEPVVEPEDKLILPEDISATFDFNVAAPLVVDTLCAVFISILPDTKDEELTILRFPPVRD